ncbi:uncharacterized protein LOC110905907 [Helianthus annuus]|uniref:uncharacterized protein LOC110905907 n=1 Tax=Helianthus annuus TaxID=4232 RepID=UPI000B904093|nr:uncharacterized protein LOC110905907 [Helianthus annuus]
MPQFHLFLSTFHSLNHTHLLSYISDDTPPPLFPVLTAAIGEERRREREKMKPATTVHGDEAVTPTTGVTPATTSGGGDGGFSLQPMKMMMLAGEGSPTAVVVRVTAGTSGSGPVTFRIGWWSRCRLRHGGASAQICAQF